MYQGLAANNGINSGSGNECFMFDWGNFPVRPKDVGLQFATLMFDIYSRIAAGSLPNCIGAQIPVPSKHNLNALSQLAVTPLQCQVVKFLTVGFPTGFEKPVPTPSSE